MTNLGDRPTAGKGRREDPRGERRRQALLAAALELLAEAGWDAITTRAVADRAAANPGLVHYHFGSLEQLRRAAVAQAITTVLDPVTGRVVAAVAADAVEEEVRRALDDTAENRVAVQLSVEVLRVSLRDEQVRRQVAQALRDAREALSGVLEARDDATTRPGGPAGMAILVIALLDGLLLHRLADPDLDTAAALAALAGLLPPSAGSPGSVPPQR